jgi:hypothetical protein
MSGTRILFTLAVAPFRLCGWNWSTRRAGGSHFLPTDRILRIWKSGSDAAWPAKQKEFERVAKHQIPTSKLQRSTNHQIPKERHTVCRYLSIEAWSFYGCWSPFGFRSGQALEFGVYSALLRYLSAPGKNLRLCASCFRFFDVAVAIVKQRQAGPTDLIVRL